MRPTSGEIFVDGQDLKNVSLNTYYKNIGYLTQEPMVFDASVRENLLYSVASKDLHKITDEKLFEVLKYAECEFITDLDTQIGEKGIRLSGGERQRLAIAKLMLKNPKIIILDEPTSALDSFSEDAITRALDKLFENKTVIIIAHRLQTVRKADKIYVIEDGKIIEEGDHHDLKQKEGHYKKMLDLQVGE
jgi:ABC-type multidrug transport system fused ATPase/permease subunit